jgi:hypothetical protein
MEDKKSIIEYYLVEFGAAPINIRRPTFSPAKSKEMYEEIEYRKKVISELIQLFKETANVTEIQAEPIDQIRFFSRPFGIDNWVLSLIQPVKITFVLSEWQQKEIALYEYLAPDVEKDKSTQFSFYYDGVCFAFFRPILKPSGIICGGPDARELLWNALQKKFELIHAAPTPLRQSYIIHLKPNPQMTEEISISNYLRYKVEIRTKTGIDNPEKFILALFKECEDDLHKYYTLTMKKQKENECRYNFDSIRQDLLKKRFELLEIPFYRIDKKSKTISELETLVQDFFDNYSTWSKLHNEIQEGVERFEDRICEPMECIGKILLDEFKFSDISIDMNLNIVELAQNNIGNYRQSFGLWITVVTSIISAIIGGLITISFMK